MSAYVKENGGSIPESVDQAADRVGRGSPLVVAEASKATGVIQLKDVLKEGDEEDRLHQLRLMGIRSTMITGDNPLTAAAIAAEDGHRRFRCPGAARRRKLRLIPGSIRRRATWSP